MSMNFAQGEPPVGQAGVSTFEFFVDDARYSVPTLLIVDARDEDGALHAAKRLLDDNGHYRGLEAWLNGERLFGLGSYADPETRITPHLLR